MLPALLFLGLGLADGGDSPLFIIYMGTAGIFLCLAAAVAYLRVRDAGNALKVALGPVRLFGRTIPYSQIASVQTTRLGPLQRWGVHGLPFLGITYHVAGKQCVRVDLREPIGLLRFHHVCIGTDEPGRLAEHIASRIEEPPDPPATP